MILFFQRTLPRYQLSLFERLNKSLGIVLCFGKKGPPNTFLSKAQPDFPHCQINDYYPFPGKENVVIQDVISPLLKFKPDIIILEFTLSILSNWLLFLLKPFLKYKIILRSHGWNRKIGFFPKKSFVDKGRIWLMNKADALIVYSQEGKDGISKYLDDPEKIFIGHNSLDVNRLIKIRDGLEKIGRENIKREVGFKEKYNLIYIGRILKDKEPDRLIDVLRIIKSRLDSVELCIAGDGPLLEELKDKCRDLNINFRGAVIDDLAMGKLLFASDLMVMPSRLGLSIVHSFCFDIPVLSQKVGENGVSHGPEIEYLKDGKTGFLTAYGDNELMAKTAIDYFLNDQQKQYMKKEIRRAVTEQCGFDRMIEGFSKAVDYAKGGKPSKNEKRQEHS